MRANRIGAVLFPLLLLTGMAAAQDKCAVPDYFVSPYIKFNHAAFALRAGKPLEILVLSSAPSQTRIGDKLRSYPMFLQTALRERLPDREIRVSVQAEPRRTTGEILPLLPKILANKPALVIWQTGTVEAMRGADADLYERQLEEGIETIRKAEADVLLVNPQYSPRTSLMTNSSAINDRIRRVAAYSDVSLFNRHDIMRHWSDNDSFDFTALKNDGSYETVHRCLGAALAEFISRAASFSEIAKLPK